MTQTTPQITIWNLINKQYSTAASKTAKFLKVNNSDKRIERSYLGDKSSDNEINIQDFYLRPLETSFTYLSGFGSRK